jgi:3-phenylpropionate/trans-cinnamate dioxygenase ferredoxin subunit
MVPPESVPGESAAVSEPTFHPALALEELPPGRMRCVIVAGREVLLCHSREGVFALDNICTHAFARMDEGRLRGVRLICPLHGASFDVRDGRVLGPPASQPLRRYAVRVVDGTIEVALAEPGQGGAADGG